MSQNNCNGERSIWVSSTSSPHPPDLILLVHNDNPFQVLLTIFWAVLEGPPTSSFLDLLSIINYCAFSHTKRGLCSVVFLKSHHFHEFYIAKQTAKTVPVFFPSHGAVPEKLITIVSIFSFFLVLGSTIHPVEYHVMFRGARPHAKCFVTPKHTSALFQKPFFVRIKSWFPP